MKKNLEMFDIIEYLRGTNIWSLFSFLGEALFILGLLNKIIKSRRKVRNFVINQSRSRDILIAVFFTITGFFAPLYLIVISYNSWTGWELWLTQILSWFILLSYIGLVIIIGIVEKILRKSEKEETQTKTND